MGDSGSMLHRPGDRGRGDRRDRSDRPGDGERRGRRCPAFLPILLPIAVLLLPLLDMGLAVVRRVGAGRSPVPPRPAAPAPPAAASSATPTAARSSSCTCGPRCSPSGRPPWSCSRRRRCSSCSAPATVVAALLTLGPLRGRVPARRTPRREPPMTAHDPGPPSTPARACTRGSGRGHDPERAVFRTALRDMLLLLAVLGGPRRRARRPARRARPGSGARSSAWVWRCCSPGRRSCRCCSPRASRRRRWPPSSWARGSPRSSSSSRSLAVLRGAGLLRPRGPRGGARGRASSARRSSTCGRSARVASPT